MVQLADGIDIQGSVQAELFVVWLHGDQLEEPTSPPVDAP